MSEPPVVEPDLNVAPHARSFVVAATGAGIAGFNVGFDVGAFGNVDHRRFWAIWVVCTVALVASYVFDDGSYRLGGRWRLALTVPTVWIVAGAVFDASNQALVTTLAVVSVLALPYGIYVLVYLVAGDFLAMSGRLQLALIALTLVIFGVGWYVGSDHVRFLTCDDFALAGEFVPDGCVP